MSFCQRFLELMLTRQERAQERNRPRGSFGVLAPFFEESNYKFTNIPLTVAFKMFFFLFYLFLLNTFIYETLNGIVFRSFPLSALSAQQVKSRTKHFSSRFKGKPSPAVARIWWIFHVFVFVFIFWKQTFLYCCCCFLFREKAAPKAKLRRRKCSWNSPKISKFPTLQFLSFEKRLWKELFVRASAARQGVPSSGKFMWDLQTYSAKKKSREKFSSRRRKNNFISADRI